MSFRNRLRRPQRNYGPGSVGFRPKKFGEPPLGHLASTERKQCFKERQRLLLHFPAVFDGSVVYQEPETPSVWTFTGQGHCSRSGFPGSGASRFLRMSSFT